MWLQAIILGIIQGIFEWLPVSSEGIVSLVMINVFGVSYKEAIPYSIFLHFGTLMSSIVFFRKDIIDIFRNFKDFKNKEKTNLTVFLLIATLLTVLVGYPLYLLILKLSFDGRIVSMLIGVFLVITGVLQLVVKKKVGKKVNIYDSFLLGIVQGFAVIPGLSRSGLTISTLLFRKYDGKLALKLSFLMAIPVVLVSSLYLLGNSLFNVYSLVSLVFAFVFGLLSIKILLKIAKKLNFGWFALVIGIISIIGGFV
jgi:undecaprenyl-diphosphatase